jgi:hypothetical protein
VTRLVKADEPWYCETKQHKSKKVMAPSKEAAAKWYMNYLGTWQWDDSLVVSVVRGGVGAPERVPTYLRVTFQGFGIFITKKVTEDDYSK